MRKNNSCFKSFYCAENGFVKRILLYFTQHLKNSGKKFEKSVDRKG